MLTRDTDLQPTLSQELVSFLVPGSLEAEQYRTLRHAVESLRRESGAQVFGITSPGAGEGKTVTTLNLAGALGQSAEGRVLIVSADLRAEAVTDYLGLTALTSPGLAGAVLNGHCSLAQVVVRIESLNISLLPAGDGHARPYELLSSSRLRALLDEARLHYDYVLIDTPPILPMADCKLLGGCVDGFIVVVASHKTPRKVLVEALKLLEPATVFGVVFNGDDHPLPPYYLSYGSPQYRRARGIPSHTPAANEPDRPR